MRRFRGTSWLAGTLVLLSLGCSSSGEGDSSSGAENSAAQAAAVRPTSASATVQPAASVSGESANDNGSTASSDAKARSAAGVPVGVQGVSDADFQEKVLKSPVPVVVDFYADWCGPCRLIAPILADLSKQYAGRVAFAKLNTDQNRRTMMANRVGGLPTVVVYKGGREVARIVGAYDRPTYEAAIKKAL